MLKRMLLSAVRVRGLSPLASPTFYGLSTDSIGTYLEQTANRPTVAWKLYLYVRFLISLIPTFNWLPIKCIHT
jgi:hypothetical protein